MNPEMLPVLVTGGSGLIGQAVCRRLAGKFRVYSFDTKPPPPMPGVEYVKMDVSSEESVRSALEKVRSAAGARVASVIHLAAYYSFSGEPSDLYEKVTVRGTEQLLRELKKRFQAEQFVFSSTMLVHAPADPGERISEDWPIRASWDYPRSKVRAEEVIHREHGPVPVAILRIAGVYDDFGHSIPIAHQIQRIYERQLTGHFYPGSLERGQAFVHLDDLVDAIERTVERRANLPPETVLLIGEPGTVSYGELQETVGRLVHGKSWRTFRIPKPFAKAGAWIQDRAPLGRGDTFIKPWMIDLADDHYALDISRAQELLGWRPRHSLRDTLPRIVAGVTENPDRWYRENKLERPGRRAA